MLTFKGAACEIWSPVEYILEKKWGEAYHQSIHKLLPTEAIVSFLAQLAVQTENLKQQGSVSIYSACTGSLDGVV